jgi:ribonuclease Z
VGMHMHVHDIAEWLRFLETKALILTHISRRTHLGQARQELTRLVGPEKAANVYFLMDGRFNRDRYERQEQEAMAGKQPT